MNATGVNPVNCRNVEGDRCIRSPGAGRPHDNTDADRLLMALMWLRVYPTYEVLGSFFDLHKRNAQLNVRWVLEVLDSLSDFPFDRPDPDRKKMRSPAEVMAAFPAVRFLIDAKEQRINKPAGEEKQKPYYSGKKKTHTIKTQLVVNPRGQIERVSDSVPGSTHDLTLLRGSGVLERSGVGEGAMMDKGYVGVDKDFPDLPLVLPYEKPRGGELSDEQRDSNRRVAQDRIVVEHTIAQVNRFTVLIHEPGLTVPSESPQGLAITELPGRSNGTVRPGSCMRQVFRGKQRERHSKVIGAVAKLVNERLAVTP